MTIPIIEMMLAIKQLLHLIIIKIFFTYLIHKYFLLSVSSEIRHGI